MVILIPRVSQSPPYFSQALKADLDDRKFWEGSTFLKYVDDLLLYPPFSNFFTGDNIHLLKFVGLKGNKASKVRKKIAVCSNSRLILRAADLQTRTTFRSRWYPIWLLTWPFGPSWQFVRNSSNQGKLFHDFLRVLIWRMYVVHSEWGTPSQFPFDITEAAP